MKPSLPCPPLLLLSTGISIDHEEELETLASLALDLGHLCVTLHRASWGNIQSHEILQGCSQQTCLPPFVLLEKARALQLCWIGCSLAGD